MPRPRSAFRKSRYFKVLRFRQLRAFCIVARELSFTRAARLLGLSGPSLWQQVRALEQELKAELVVSDGNTLLLTEEGQELLEIASPLVAGFDSVRELFADRRQQMQRSLTVATTGSLLANELPPIVQAYRELHPEVRLGFIERPSREALELLDSGGADLAVAGVVDRNAVSATIAVEPCGHYPFVLICPTKHPLARRRTPTLAEIVAQPLVMPAEATNSRSLLDRVFRDAGVDDSLNIVIESFNADTIVRYVEVGLGIAVVSMSPTLRRRLAKDGKSSLHTREVSSLFGRESLILAYRRGRLLPPHINAFVAMTLKVLA